MSTGEFYRKPAFIVAGIAGLAAAAFYLTKSKRQVHMKTVPNAINPDTFTPLKLHQVWDLSHNTKKFRFAFNDPNATLGLHVASCLLVKADAPVKSRKTGEFEVKNVVRPYTPVSEKEQKGYVDLVVKSYEFGAMSQHMFNMKIGDHLLFKGPLEKLTYEPNKWKHVGMLSGGTGLTPMLQVIKEIVGNPSDKTKVSMIFANVSEKDILIKEDLDKLAKQHPGQLNIFYTIDKVEGGDWNGFIGYIDEKKYKGAGLPLPDQSDVITLVCGPPGFMKVMSGDKLPDKSQGEVDPSSLLGKMGFKSDKVYKF